MMQKIIKIQIIILSFIVSSCSDLSSHIVIKYDTIFGDTISIIEENTKTGISKVIFFTDDKRIYAISHFKNEKLHGESIEYCDNNQLKSIVVYNQDKIVEIKEYYNKQGKKLNFGYIDKGNGYLYRYNCDGVLNESGPVVDGYRNGYWNVYYTNGIEVRDSVLYINGVSQDDFQLFLTFY